MRDAWFFNKRNLMILSLTINQFAATRRRFIVFATHVTTVILLAINWIWGS
jgi:hypothetical protein